MNVAAMQRRDRGMLRLIADLRAIDRLGREPRSCGFTRLQDTLGRRMAAQALVTVETGRGR
jgi:hypothetical protein